MNSSKREEGIAAMEAAAIRWAEANPEYISEECPYEVLFDAALAAMRVPTEAMIEAGMCGIDDNSLSDQRANRYEAIACWHNMITAAASTGRGGVREKQTCLTCEGTGWVCENHRDNAWAGMTGHEECCGGAGSPCGSCQLEAASAGCVDAERRAIVGMIKQIGIASTKMILIAGMPVGTRTARTKARAFADGYCKAVIDIHRAIQRGDHLAPPPPSS